jgi:hypothetical protein
MRVSFTSTFTAILNNTPIILNFACQKQKLRFHRSRRICLPDRYKDGGATLTPEETNAT